MSKSNEDVSDIYHEGEHYAGPYVWGNHYWNMLHVFSISAAHKPGHMFHFFLKVLPELLPCAACRSNHILQMIDGHLYDLAKITVLCNRPYSCSHRRFLLIVFVCVLRFTVTNVNLKCKKRVKYRLFNFFKRVMYIDVPFFSKKSISEALESVKDEIVAFGTFVPYKHYSKDCWFMLHMSAFTLPPNDEYHLEKQYQYIQFSWFLRNILFFIPDAHRIFVLRHWSNVYGGLCDSSTFYTNVVDEGHTLRKINDYVSNIITSRKQIILFLYQLHQTLRNAYIGFTDSENINNYTLSYHTRKYRELVFLIAEYKDRKINQNFSITTTTSSIDAQDKTLLFDHVHISLQIALNDAATMLRYLQLGVYGIRQKSSSHDCNPLQLDFVTRRVTIHRTFQLLKPLIRNGSQPYVRLTEWLQDISLMNHALALLSRSAAVIKRSGDCVREYDNHPHHHKLGFFYDKDIDTEYKPYFSALHLDQEHKLQEGEASYQQPLVLFSELDLRSILSRLFHSQLFSIFLSSTHRSSNKNNSSLLEEEHEKKSHTTQGCDAMLYSRDSYCNKPAVSSLLRHEHTLHGLYKLCPEHQNYTTWIAISLTSKKNAEYFLFLIDRLTTWSAQLAKICLTRGGDELSNHIPQAHIDISNQFLCGFQREQKNTHPRRTPNVPTITTMTVLTQEVTCYMFASVYSTFLSNATLIMFLGLVRTCVYTAIDTRIYLEKKWPLYHTLPSINDCRLQLSYTIACKHLDKLFNLVNPDDNNVPVVALHLKSKRVIRILFNPNASQVVEFQEESTTTHTTTIKPVLKSGDIKVCAWIKGEKFPIRSSLASIYVVMMHNIELHNKIQEFINNNKNKSQDGTDTVEEEKKVQSKKEMTLLDILWFFIISLSKKHT